MAPWLKAGLVGAAVLVVLALLGFVPCVGACTCLIGVLAYAGIGALAAYWMPPVREAGPAAGQGALAAILASLIGGIANTIVMLIQTATVSTEQILSQIPPEMLQQFEQTGMDPRFLETLAGPTGGLLSGSMCCMGGLILAAILGAIGGAVYAGIQPGQAHED